MKKIIILLTILALITGCKTAPAAIPTTPYVNQVGTQASTIVTQTIEVEKIVTKMVTDEKSKTEALNAIGALKATATEHVKTIATLKNVNGIVAQNYGNMRDKMIKYRGQRNAAFIILISAAFVIIGIMLLKRLIKS